MKKTPAPLQVVRGGQAVPHSRADIVLLPDWEEVQQQQAVALDALEEGTSRDLPVAAAMQASVVAAERAAAAASAVGLEGGLWEGWGWECGRLAAADMWTSWTA